jgi:hypothetical protein
MVCRLSPGGRWIRTARRDWTFFETTLIDLRPLHLRGKQLTSPKGPRVCIQFAPTVSQTNFRIAPLARPDFVERQPMCWPIRRLIIRAGWRALDFRSGTTELCGISVGAPRRRRRKSAPWRVSPWLADFVQDGRFWRRIAERSLYAEVMGQSAVRRSSITLKWRAAPVKSRRDWLVALPAQVRVENGRVGNRNRREWRAPHRGNPCSPLSGTPPRARPLR